MHPRTTQILLFSAILLIHLIFLILSLNRVPDPLSDTVEYLHAASNLYEEGTLYCGDLSDPIREELYTRRPPLYPILLGIAVATGSNLPVQLLQVLFSLFSLLLIVKIFQPHLQSGRNLFYLVILLFILATPAQFIYASRIMTEIPFQLILVLMAWCIYRYFDPGSGEVPSGRRGMYVWLFFLLLSAGMAMKPVLFPFVIPVALFSLFVYARTKRTIWLVALAIPLFWITAYSLRNSNRTGSIQYSSIQTANLVNYNLRYFLMAGEGGEKAAQRIDTLYSRCGNEPGYAEKNRCLSRGVRETVAKEPFRYALFHLKGSVRYFIDPGRFDLVTFFNLAPPGSTGILRVMNEEGISGILRFLRSQGWGWIFLLGLLTVFKLLKLAGALLYLFRGTKEIYFRIFVGLLIGYLALVTGPLGASRFLLPVELLIIGASLKGWLMLLKRSDPSPYSSSIL
jgi:hypothetical protein